MYIQSDENGVKTTTEAGWKLIHNGTVVSVLNNANGVTSTAASNELFVSATKAECETEIARLGLTKPAHIQ